MVARCRPEKMFGALAIIAGISQSAFDAAAAPCRVVVLTVDRSARSSRQQHDRRMWRVNILFFVVFNCCLACYYYYYCCYYYYFLFGLFLLVLVFLLHRRGTLYSQCVLMYIAGVDVREEVESAPTGSDVRGWGVWQRALPGGGGAHLLPFSFFLSVVAPPPPPVHTQTAAAAIIANV